MAEHRLFPCLIGLVDKSDLESDFIFMQGGGGIRFSHLGSIF